MATAGAKVLSEEPRATAADEALAQVAQCEAAIEVDHLLAAAEALEVARDPERERPKLAVDREHAAEQVARKQAKEDEEADPWADVSGARRRERSRRRERLLRQRRR